MLSFSLASNEKGRNQSVEIYTVIEVQANGNLLFLLIWFGSRIFFFQIESRIDGVPIVG